MPDADDVALAKVVAWRDKDWLASGIRAKLFSLDRMAARLALMPEGAPGETERVRRLSSPAAACQVTVPALARPTP